MAPPAMRPGVPTALAAFAALAGVVGAVHYLELPSLLAERKRSRKVEKRCYSAEDTFSLAAFETLISQITLPSTYPLATDVQKNIPIYDGRKFNLEDSTQAAALKDELFHILHSGPGVFIIKSFFTNPEIIDSANTAYAAIIARERAEFGAKGDHFAASDAASPNSRIWNSFSKHCNQSPESFLAYFSNPLFDLVHSAYLGPAYRLTSQVNIVHPGGQAQNCHRDYHLGFQTTEDVAKWPKAVHEMTKLLTLQGAVAHTDMPVESGPTRFLPFSQNFDAGFMAYRQEDFQKFFNRNYVALPLAKGDAVFFSPALFHAAGSNDSTSDFSRSANLIQVSSAFGKTMETIDSLPLVDQTWDLLKQKYDDEGLSMEVDALVKALGEGYPFPTNLDRRPPAPGGLAPESEQDILRKGLKEGWSKEKVGAQLREMREAGQA